MSIFTRILNESNDFIRFLTDPIYRWIDQNRKILLRVLIISFVLLFGVFQVPNIVSGQSMPLYLLLIFVLLIGFIILLRWPVLGLIASILGGMFVKIVGPSGLNAAVGGVAAMLGLWWLKMMVEERKIRIILNRTTISLYLFILVSILSFLIGQLPWYWNAQHAPMQTQLAGLAIFILSAGAFLLVAHLVHDIRWLKALTWIFIALGAIYVLGRFVKWGGIDRIYINGFTAGAMFWTWLVAMTFGQALFNRDLKLHWRGLLGVIVIVTFYIAYVKAYSWKSGWVPPLVAVAAILGFRYWRPTLFMVPVALIFAYYVAIQLVGTDAYSWGTRIDAWIIVFAIVQANPVMGLGFANYYWVTPLFMIRGYEVKFNSHNQYMDILAETGFVGLACYVWFLGEVGKLGWRLRERMPDGFSRAYVYGVLGGLAGTIIAGVLVDWVLPFVYNIGLTGFRASVLAWLFMGGLVSLERMFQEGVDHV